MVLAVLLGNRNRLVSRDVLIDSVWAGAPPAAAKTSLHTYLSHLRESLGDSAINHHDGGYSITATAKTLDAMEFEELVARALSLSRTDPFAAAGTLDRALELWRGPPYGDLADQPALMADGAQLSERRLQAEEERAETYLALGRHGQAIAHLSRLTGENPYRERFYGQLMVALYRAGRQTEALAVFSTLRDRLREDLGVDPLPQLWSLEERILVHDPDLLPPGQVAPPSGPPPPAPPPDPGPTLPETAEIATTLEPGPGPSPRPTRRLGSAAVLVGVLVLGLLGGFFTQELLTRRARISSACVPLPSGLTGWWGGDRSGEDLIGGRDGSLVDGAGFGPGLVGDAFAFDGHSYVEVPHDHSLDPGLADFTVDLWVLFNSTDGDQVLVEKWIQTEQGGVGWTFQTHAGDRLGFYGASLGSGLGATTLPLSIPAGEWKHMAARRQGPTVDIWMDGRSVASYSTPGAERFHVGSTASLKFGHRGSPSDTSGSVDNSGKYIEGMIDEVHLYVGRALPPAEIDAISAAGEAGLCSAR
jgi:DNA-binding SARP family transcriptional activator